MAEDRKPIGYWLKHLDRLIDESFDRLLAGEGLTRRHWQILNTLRDAPATRAALAEAVAPFVANNSDDVAHVIDDLNRRGWVQPAQNGTLELTPDGVSSQAALLERVKATRRQVVHGISEEEYRTVIDVLSRMATNLEPETAS
jgi:DNA-binding MarR family transcriptional regulator